MLNVYRKFAGETKAYLLTTPIGYEVAFHAPPKVEQRGLIRATVYIQKHVEKVFPHVDLPIPFELPDNSPMRCTLGVTLGLDFHVFPEEHAVHCPAKGKRVDLVCPWALRKHLDTLKAFGVATASENCSIRVETQVDRSSVVNKIEVTSLVNFVKFRFLADQFQLG
ncbi:hypothetical protein F441_06428 [Phytophthora nicotianae CJ01A1]|uniref:Uncharacterized protein n=1 Tax=Phytophthora nicotianae CJ01A1 TaxID=1317063 RepID=W2XAD4_PHYNI|nr:hypothetical protein F441_06428 [Phytophthora nicotianae CJ01A1]